MESHEIGEFELLEYGQSLGVDIGTETELKWVVEEAFNAPLPASWTEHQDGEGRVFFFQESSNQSSWEHPLDAVYRELLSLVKQVLAEVGLSPDTESERLAIVQGHLTKIHQQAVDKLEGWSGPYTAEAGEYYYHAGLKLSTWESPLMEWEQELTLRHAVLCKCLLPDSADAPGDINGNSPRDLLLTSLKLPLSTLKRDVSSDGQPDTPSARSFHTPRSGESARSQRSGRSSQPNLARVEERRPSSRGLGDDDGENEFTFGGTNQAAASVLGQNKAAIAARYTQQR